MSTLPDTAPAAPRARFPPQIAYIIGNEGCERFSFYGMRNILTTFLASTLLVYLPEVDREGAAKEVFHTFVIGVYFFPLLGGWLADRLVGKYSTIFWLSLLYTLGHACLAWFESVPTGFYVGLALIAVGSGGIKPCVSSFVGDQFDQSNKHLAKIVFDAFYWIINFGSFFATLLAPKLLVGFGPAVAFGVPGVLMALATLVFWFGRHRYVRVPPNRAGDPNGFFAVCRTAIGSSRLGTAIASIGAALAAAVAVSVVVGTFAGDPWLGFIPGLALAFVLVLASGGIAAALTLDGASTRHPPEAIEGVRSVLRLLVLFALVTPFWSLFDQKASTWVFQGDAMTKPSWFLPAQMQALNPALVMILIPLNNLVVFPLLRRAGFEPTALRRMTLGIALAGVSWLVVAAMQMAMDGGSALSIVWQVVPYLILTAGEVLVSATGLEFAYSQAPRQMKGTLMSFWNLTVTVGNLWVLLVNAGVKNATVDACVASTGLGIIAFQMVFFALFAFAAAALFGLYAARYPTADHYREARLA